MKSYFVKPPINPPPPSKQTRLVLRSDLERNSISRPLSEKLQRIQTRVCGEIALSPFKWLTARPGPEMGEAARSGNNSLNIAAPRFISVPSRSIIPADQEVKFSGKSGRQSVLLKPSVEKRAFIIRLQEGGRKTFFSTAGWTALGTCSLERPVCRLETIKRDDLMRCNTLLTCFSFPDNAVV